MRVGIIILAAGESRRLGRPKQMVPFRGTTLLRHIISVALEVGPVTVVLGARFEEISQSLADLPVRIVENEDWAEGMASSIRAGLTAIESEVDRVILMLCDQPLVTAESLRRLVASWDLAASEYAGTVGAPALFGRQYFEELKALKGSQGAKVVLARHRSKVAAVPCSECAIDIDLVDDLKHLGGHFPE